MCEELVCGRARKGEKWVDVQYPRCIAEFVRALNVAHLDVVGATCECITLADGRTLHVRRGFRVKDA